MTSMPAWEEHSFISFDETPIFYRRMRPVTAVRGIALIVHGMGEHGGRYRHVAAYLADRGFEAVAADLRGFGKSGGKKAFAGKFSDYCGDLLALHSFVARNSKNLPVFLVGHSFGGLVCSTYAAGPDHPKIQGIVLSSPIFGIALSVPPWRHLLGVLVSYISPGFSQATRVLPDFLTHDQEVLRLYQKDPLIYHRVSARLYVELIRKLHEIKGLAEKIYIPVLVLQAGDDRVVLKEKTIQFYEWLKSEDKSLQIFEGFYHEIFNEIGRERVLAAMGDWIVSHTHGIL